MTAAQGGCAHLERDDRGICVACGHCIHDVVLNGACVYCGSTDIDPAERSPRKDLLIPPDQLTRKKKS
jgi:hypothetical protein